MFNLLQYYARWAKFYRRRRQPKKLRSIRPTLENLEDRLVPASLMVTSPLDNGAQNTLRWAITTANENSSSSNTIFFDLSATQVIIPNSPLPAITKTITFNGGANPGGTVTLDGANAGPGANGLVLDANGCLVGGMTFIDWNGDGIEINSNDNNIVGSSFGIQLDQFAEPNHNGIAIENGSYNTIGGIVPADANTISLNSHDGIIIDGGSDNAVLNNFIGTNKHGVGYFGNGNDGIHIFGNATLNYIGETESGDILGNVISGNNAGAGVEISGAGATENILVDNKIGTDLDGTTAYANKIGVELDEGTTENFIGGGGADDANVISGNIDDGVYITDNGTNDNNILGNQIGTQLGGEAKLGNGLMGVDIENNANSNFVTGNVISGNAADGVYITTNDNQLQANLIGTDLNGTKALANSQNGVEIEGLDTDGNLVGGAFTSLGNTISGNTQDGVYIFDQCQDNTVIGNFIGVNPADNKALPNQENGVEIDGNSTGNYIGSTAAGMAAGNVISGNAENGVQIDRNTSGNFVFSNQIGTDQTGTLKLPNEQSGVAVFGNTGNAIGSATGGNLIVYNKLDGVVIYSYAQGDTVEGNRIGTNGTVAMPNGQNGVEISGNSSDNTIGGSAPGDGNLISGNGVDGVLINLQSDGNFVQGNIIGLNEVLLGFLEEQTGKLANGRDGVEIANQSDNNTIGGQASGDGNTISGNAHDGVEILTGADGNILESNLIGTVAVSLTNSGTGFGNGDNGVYLNGVTGNFIGDVATVDEHKNVPFGNVISGNTEDGVILQGTGTTNNTIEANDIGTNPGATAAVANGNNGVAIVEGASDNTVGGTATSDGNNISGNDDVGIELRSTGTTGNKIENNIIGFSSTQTPLPNKDGIDMLDGASNNTVGGANLTNVIAGNTRDGVIVQGDSNGDLISQNSIYDNGAIGIDLGNSGTTLTNKPPQTTGPNDFQDYPVLSAPTAAGVINGTLSGAAGNYTVEFFASATSTPGQGQLYLGSIPVTITTAGIAEFSYSVPNTALPFITATATSSSHNTSEFSAPVPAGSSGAGNALTGTAGTALSGVIATFNPGFTATAADFTATINWGDVSGVPGTNLPPDTSPGTVMAVGSGFEVMGTHTYAQPGMYDVTVTITGPDGFSMTIMSSVDVSMPALHG